MSEIVSYHFTAGSGESRKEVSFTTKPEHKKIRGIFLSAEGNADLSKCYVEIRIDGRNVVSYGDMQASIIQKTKYLSVDDAKWDCDVEVNNSTIKVVLTNGTGSDIGVNLNLIAER